MRSKHRLLLHQTYPFLAMGLWLAWPVWAWPQSISATLPLTGAGNAVAINKATNKIYVAGFGSGGTKQKGVVTIIDGINNAATTVQVGVWPLAVAVNETTNKIYVANYGNLPLGLPGSITVIDGATNSTTTITDPNARNPRSLAVNPSTNKVYVANFSTGNVTVIDGATYSTTTVTDPNAMNLAAYAIAVNTVTNKIYVANNDTDRAANNPGNVTVIDGITNSTATVTDPNAFSPVDVAVNQVTDKIYVANEGDGQANHGNVTVIDGVTNATTTVTDRNALAPGGPDSRGFSVAVDSTRNNIYVTNEGSNNVTIIDGATNSTSTVTDPNALLPVAVAVDEATNRIYVANGGCLFGSGCGPGTNPGSVTIITGGSNSTTTLIDPKAVTPVAAAVNSVTNQFYVANLGGNLTAIDGAGIATTHTLAVVLAGGGSGTVASTPSGIDCGISTCATSFAVGTPVSLNASAASGSDFVGWSGPCSGTSPCDVVANDDQFVTATFNSTAPMQVAVPNVVGQTQAAATTAITGAGLVPGTMTQQASSAVASGNVISESPAAGTNVSSGSTVNLVVSTGSSTGGGGYGGGGGIDSLTLGALLSALLATLRRGPFKSARARAVATLCCGVPDVARYRSPRRNHNFSANDR